MITLNLKHDLLTKVDYMNKVDLLFWIICIIYYTIKIVNR